VNVLRSNREDLDSVEKMLLNRKKVSLLNSNSRNDMVLNGRIVKSLSGVQLDDELVGHELLSHCSSVLNLVNHHCSIS